ncbi:MAG: hypothetical protein ACLFS9_07660 [Nitriliruptoraceae bacterium]
MRPTLIAGGITAALLVAGAAVAAEATMASTQATSTAEADVAVDPVADGHEDRLGDRLERRSERRVERRERIAAFVGDVAEELDLETEEIRDAVAAVLSDRLDAAVGAGTIDPERADELQDALEDGEENAIREARLALLRASLAERAPDLDDGV